MDELGLVGEVRNGISKVRSANPCAYNHVLTSPPRIDPAISSQGAANVPYKNRTLSTNYALELDTQRHTRSPLLRPSHPSTHRSEALVFSWPSSTKPTTAEHAPVSSGSGHPIFWIARNDRLGSYSRSRGHVERASATEPLPAIFRVLAVSPSAVHT
ncbi:hypothetical protein FA13DRAFT_1871182 [Coprinellus micaceus]|uniref:Uncharacterized protein n=1 Tax=Coprinellus micaceus TaxID=71717 RepID=A0A4Y7T384_COPMI|nr:hypothetical protein FA13DRAFT_1871182 [Coprinellus micaceus]